jgi:GTP-binding protein
MLLCNCDSCLAPDSAPVALADNDTLGPTLRPYAPEGNWGRFIYQVPATRSILVKKPSSVLRNAEFVRGAPSLAALPADDGLEVAFAGRSNAGKSSALNALTGRKALARTSRTPGRTQHINFFDLGTPDLARRLVDLPGYGYAKVTLAIRQQWEHTVHRYLETRRSLRGLVLVSDIRHALTEGDQRMLDWCAAAGMPVHVLLTKADKLSRGQAAAACHKVERLLDQDWPGTTAQAFSAPRREGIEQAQDCIAAWLQYDESSGQKKAPVKGG